MHRSRIYRALGLAACVFPVVGGLVGCADKPASDNGIFPVDGIVLAVSDPGQLEVPASIGRASQRYEPWDDESSGRLLESWDGDEGSWVRTRQRIDGKDHRVISVARYRLDDAGQIVLTERIDHVERVEVVFEPPLVVFPAEIVGGVPFEQELRMTVHPIGDRSRVRAQGDATSVIELVSVDELETGAGRVRADRIRSELKASLSPASVRSTTEQWWRATDDGVVLVAERFEERTTMLGVAFRHAEHAWVATGQSDD